MEIIPNSLKINSDYSYNLTKSQQLPCAYQILRYQHTQSMLLYSHRLYKVDVTDNSITEYSLLITTPSYATIFQTDKLLIYDDNTDLLRLLQLSGNEITDTQLSISMCKPLSLSTYDDKSICLILCNGIIELIPYTSLDLQANYSYVHNKNHAKIKECFHEKDINGYSYYHSHELSFYFFMEEQYMCADQHDNYAIIAGKQVHLIDLVHNKIHDIATELPIQKCKIISEKYIVLHYSNGTCYIYSIMQKCIIYGIKSASVIHDVIVYENSKDLQSTYSSHSSKSFTTLSILCNGYISEHEVLQQTIDWSLKNKACIVCDIDSKLTRISTTGLILGSITNSTIVGVSGNFQFVVYTLSSSKIITKYSPTVKTDQKKAKAKSFESTRAIKEIKKPSNRYTKALPKLKKIDKPTQVKLKAGDLLINKQINIKSLCRPNKEAIQKSLENKKPLEEPKGNLSMEICKEIELDSNENEDINKFKLNYEYSINPERYIISGDQAKLPYDYPNKYHRKAKNSIQLALSPCKEYGHSRLLHNTQSTTIPEPQSEKSLAHESSSIRSLPFSYAKRKEIRTKYSSLFKYMPPIKVNQSISDSAKSRKWLVDYPSKNKSFADKKEETESRNLLLKSINHKAHVSNPIFRRHDSPKNEAISKLSRLLTIIEKRLLRPAENTPSSLECKKPFASMLSDLHFIGPERTGKVCATFTMAEKEQIAKKVPNIANLILNHFNAEEMITQIKQSKDVSTCKADKLF